MGNAYMKQHLETATKTGVLRIAFKKLNEVPDTLKQLQNVLRTLDMSDNKFVTIPPWIGTFKLLKHLTINNNRITSLPEEIGQLSKLETLAASGNRLIELPITISQLKNLKNVDFSGNKLTMFPAIFKGLKHLDVLDLSKNQITDVPTESIDGLNCVELNLNQNQIATLAPEICKCPRLKTLRLEENCLQLATIQPVLSDSNVSLLSLEGNLFDMKVLTHADGYEKYMERYTAVKKKMF